jgi:archaeal flagellar protein FlaI
MEAIRLNTNPNIPAIPKSSDKTKINVRYMVLAPYVSIHIYWNPNISELVYEVEEPVLNEGEKKDLSRIEEAMREMINVDLMKEDNSSGDTISYMQKSAEMIISELGLRIPEESFKNIFYYLYRNFVGLNEVEGIIRDYFIEDIECNGVNQPIYVIHRVFRNLRTNVRFEKVDVLANFVEKLAQKCGRYISYASPILDGSLPDGSRVNATYTKDITSKGPTFTIRKFTKVPWTPVQLIGFNSLSPEMLAYFWLLLEHGSSMMIVGGTASGKTTLLNAIAFFIPPEDRVVSIEDTRELNLPRENWLPSVVRTGIGSQGGAGEVDMFNLLKASFRQAPDYVIVGEVRGPEASVLFQGMASGHASISTLHADSVQAIVNRLSTPPINLSPTLINSLDVIAIQTHAIVGGQDTRRLREVIEVLNVNPNGSFLTNTPFKWNPGDDKFYIYSESKVFDKISKKTGIPRQELINEFRIRTKLLYTLYKKKILGYEDVQRVINEYNKNRKAVLDNFGIT